MTIPAPRSAFNRAHCTAQRAPAHLHVQRVSNRMDFSRDTTKASIILAQSRIEKHQDSFDDSRHPA